MLGKGAEDSWLEPIVKICPSENVLTLVGLEPHYGAVGNRIGSDIVKIARLTDRKYPPVLASDEFRKIHIYCLGNLTASLFSQSYV